MCHPRSLFSYFCHSFFEKKPTRSLGSVEFSHNGKRIYYNDSAGVILYNLEDDSKTTLSGGKGGIRRTLSVDTTYIFLTNTRILLSVDEHNWTIDSLPSYYQYGDTLPDIMTNTNITAQPHRILYDFEQYAYRFTGKKSYYLNDHLGNVRVVVSDRKEPIGGSLVSISGFTSSILQSTDYYPFGMNMPGREYSIGLKARFGYNGKEADPEWNNGAIYDYGFRIYDARIGKFLSVDPLKDSYPWNSVYAYAENDVIRCIDLDGLEKLYSNLPGAYLKEGTMIDMSNAPDKFTTKSGAEYVTKYNALGNKSNSAWYWDQVSSAHPEYFDASNQALINKGLSPQVNSTWVAHHPEHGSWVGEILEHHHLNHGSTAYALPKTLHTGAGFTKYWHYFGKNMLTVKSMNELYKANLFRVGTGYGIPKALSTFGVIKNGVKFLPILGIGLSFYNIATANNPWEAVKEELGAEGGALIGAKIGGPPGAILGGIIGGLTVSSKSEGIDGAADFGTQDAYTAPIYNPQLRLQIRLPQKTIYQKMLENMVKSPNELR